VAVFVTADESLYLKPLKLQLNATLGYPVLHALGRLTFRQDGSLHVEAMSPERDPHSATLWLADHSLLIELGTRPVFNGKMLGDVADDRLLILDTGSAGTVLTDRYLAEHNDLLAISRRRPESSPVRMERSSSLATEFVTSAVREHQRGLRAPWAVRFGAAN
jgi:hypothetical protein